MSLSLERDSLQAYPMNSPSVSQRLKKLLYVHLEPDQASWLDGRLAVSLEPPSGRDLFLTYTLIGRKLPDGQVPVPAATEDRLWSYLGRHGIRLDQLARIFL